MWGSGAEKIFMTTAPPGGTTTCARGAVADIAYPADLSIYLVKLPTGKVVRVTPANTSRSRRGITGTAGVYRRGTRPGTVVVTR